VDIVISRESLKKSSIEKRTLLKKIRINLKRGIF
jgi:hypothetical protein